MNSLRQKGILTKVL